MARVTLEVLEQTLFSQGLGARAPSEFQRAVTRYFDTLRPPRPARPPGRAVLPAARLGRLRGRATLSFFDEAVDDIIAARKR